MGLVVLLLGHELEEELALGAVLVPHEGLTASADLGVQEVVDGMLLSGCLGQRHDNLIKGVNQTYWKSMQGAGS